MLDCTQPKHIIIIVSEDVRFWIDFCFISVFLVRVRVLVPSARFPYNTTVLVLVLVLVLVPLRISYGRKFCKPKKNSFLRTSYVTLSTGNKTTNAQNTRKTNHPKERQNVHRTAPHLRYSSLHTRKLVICYLT